jgi:hypothetical protein
VDFLKRSFHAVLDIDMCSRKITLAVEKLKIDLSVLDYTWGMLNFVIMKKVPLPVSHHRPYNTASSLPPCQHLMCFTPYTHQGWIHQVIPDTVAE